MNKLYRVFDRHTQQYVSEAYKCIKRCRRRADKLDNLYGGYRYHAKEVEA